MRGGVLSPCVTLEVQSTKPYVCYTERAPSHMRAPLLCTCPPLCAVLLRHGRWCDAPLFLPFFESEHMRACGSAHCISSSDIQP